MVEVTQLGAWQVVIWRAMLTSLLASQHQGLFLTQTDQLAIQLLQPATQESDLLSIVSLLGRCKCNLYLRDLSKNNVNLLLYLLSLFSV